MYGVSIDDEPDAPVGTPATRRTIAIHWNWTTEYSHEEMATALGITAQTIRKYLSEGPVEEVRERMEDVEKEVRLVAVAELKSQLQAAGHSARTADKPVEVWQDTTGNVVVKDKADDTGEVVDRYPVPQDYELMPDHERRYYARAEVRDILDQLADLTGAGEPDELNVGGEGITIRTEAPKDDE